MNIGKYIFVLPIRQRTVSHDALAIGIYVCTFSGIIAVSSAPSENQNIKIMLLEILTLRLVLNNGKPPARIGTVLRK